MSGVIPPIFASSLLCSRRRPASWFGTGERDQLAAERAAMLGAGQPLHMLLYAGLIIFFASSTPRWCSTRRRPRRT
jgi:preprotein translocase subunit SecY